MVGKTWEIYDPAPTPPFTTLLYEYSKISVLQHKFTNNHMIIQISNVRRRPLEHRSTSKKIDRVDGSQIVRGEGRLRKTISKTIQKDLIINGISKDTVYDRIQSIQRHRLIHVANNT